MKVLWVFAHPEPRSFNGSLKDDAVQALTRAGHEVRVRDLYTMKFKPIADGDDFPKRDSDERLEYGIASAEAYAAGTQAADVVEEQRHLVWSDTVIMQFPLWWFSMPAILKGWIERVYALGFAYGIMSPGNPARSVRYGEGGLEGRRSMLVVTASGRETALGPRGVGGHIDDLLFPIQHGMLWYPGMSVLPPFVTYNIGRGRVPPERYAEISRQLQTRVLSAEATPPIPFRFQNRGDYDEHLVLKSGLEGDSKGLAIHLRRDV